MFADHIYVKACEHYVSKNVFDKAAMFAYL